MARSEFPSEEPRSGRGPTPAEGASRAARWRRVRELLEAALEVPPTEREAWLTRAAGGDAALAAEVRDLLAGDDADLEPPELPLATPLGRPRTGGAPQGDAGAAAGGRADAEMLGSTVGPYRIVGRVASGGMGTVWRAVRADGQFTKEVAVKLVKRGMDTDEILRRFQRERQVLANLEHPGIARLVDGGASADGRPFLVMELVGGVPIDRYCDENRLSVPERLALFREVCAAVHYAHQSLVVHRDLKPTNILVTPEGRPKLLDFGIAKVLDPEKTAATLQLTGAAPGLMTPEYASPEQVRGGAVTTASDVYSLGVILYRLLTGRGPYRLTTRTPADIERVVCDEDPDRPSTVLARGSAAARPDGPPPEGARPAAAARPATPEEVARRRRTTPKALRRLLAGDLDTIVLMALRKEPRRRYGSAAELAEDLERLEAGLPVRARPDTLGYRAAKFARRNGWALAAAAAVFVALVAGLVATTREARRADRASERAEEQRALAVGRAEELERAAEELAAEERLAQERLVAVQALAADLDRQRTVAEERFDDVRRFATTLIFDLHDAIRPLPGATAARELLVRTGLEHLDRLAADAAGDPELARELVEAYLRLGEVQGSTSSENLGRGSRTVESFERAVELARTLWRETGAPADGHLLARALFDLGSTLRSVGPEARGRAELEAALELCLELQERDPRPRGPRFLEALARTELVDARLTALSPADVAASLDAARAGLEDLLLEEPADAEVLDALARVHGVRGRAHRQRGEWRSAAAALERGVAVLEQAVEAPGDRAVYERNLRLMRDELADTLMHAGERERALDILLASAEACAAALAADPDDARARRDVLVVHQRLGQLQTQLGALEDAVSVFEVAEREARRLVELDPTSALARLELARVLVLSSDARRSRLLAADPTPAERTAGLERCLAMLEEAERLQAELSRGRPGDPDLAWERFACLATQGQTLSALAEGSERPIAWRRGRWLRAEERFRSAHRVLTRARDAGAVLPEVERWVERLEGDAERCAARAADLGEAD